MNNDHAPSVLPGTPCCGNCAFHQPPPDQQAGPCYRYPPTIIVMHQQRADVVNAAQKLVQMPIAVRPTMQPHEFCGEFMPRVPPRAKN